jgi:hypothetical protein
MHQMELFEAELRQLRSDVDALRSGSDIVPPPQGGRAEKRRRQVYDADNPEVTTPSIEPLPEVQPPRVLMNDVPAKIQEMETILQGLLRTVFGPLRVSEEGRFSEKVPKYGLVAESQWSWEHIKNGQANLHDIRRRINYWEPWWYGLYADLGNSDELFAGGTAMILARQQKKNPAAEVAAEVAGVASGSSYSAFPMVDVTPEATQAPSPWVAGSDTWMGRR